jgi:hypothetical protein
MFPAAAAVAATAAAAAAATTTPASSVAAGNAPCQTFVFIQTTTLACAQRRDLALPATLWLRVFSNLRPRLLAVVIAI